MQLAQLPALALVGTLGFLSGLAVHQEPEEVPQDATNFMQMQMEAMQLAMPGPEHEDIARGVGDWDVETTMFIPPMPGMPEMAPMKSTGKATNEMILGGRWMRMETSGTMGGMPMASVGFVGFDRRHDEYVTVGFDTMGTYFVTGRGKRGEDGIIRMAGTDDDGYGGQDYVFEIDDSDDDRVKMRILFSKMGGMVFDPPHAMVEMVQTRRKDG